MVKINFSDWNVPDGLSITDSWCGTAFRKDMLIPCLQQEPDSLVLSLMVDGPGSGGLPLPFLKAALSGLQAEFPKTQILPECASRAELDVAMDALGENPEEAEETLSETHASVSAAPVSKGQIKKFLEAVAGKNPSIWELVPTDLKSKRTFLLNDGGYQVEVTRELLRPEEFRTLLCLSDGEAVLLAASSKDFPELIPLYQAIDARRSKLQKALNHFIQA